MFTIKNVECFVNDLKATEWDVHIQHSLLIKNQLNLFDFG